MYCTNCGNKLDDNKKCSNCLGNVVNNKDTGKNNNGLRVASIVLGILGIVSGITGLFSIFGIIFSLIGFILSLCALKKGKNALGIVLNIIGLVLSILFLILVVIGFRYIINLDFDNIFDDVSSENVYKYDFSSIDLDTLYNNNISIDDVLSKVDKIILDKMYVEDKEMTDEIEETVEYYYSVYKQYYGYTKEEFLFNSGFNNEEEFLESLRLEYRRNKYVMEYVRKKIDVNDVNDFYQNEVFGEVDSKHILVPVGEDGLSDIDAKNLANEIIKKLDNGMTWDSVIEKYKDRIISENLGYFAYNASLEKEYLLECKNLSVGKYSSIPVRTSYGYHIVYKIAQKEKPSINDEIENIMDVLRDRMMEKDKNLYNKALIFMRKDNGFDFDGTVYEELYNQYVEKYK